MSDSQAKLTAFYADTGIVLQTQSGARVLMPVADAAELAYAILRAIDGFITHRKLIDDVNDALDDGE